MRRATVMLSVLAASLVGPAAVAAPLVGGSTGADGDFNCANGDARQVVLPPDGRLNYATVDIGAGCNVTFVKNAMNTPVYLLATGSITVAGAINVSGSPGTANSGGEGGPGGFAGGAPRVGNSSGGWGLGPGGGGPGKDAGSGEVVGCAAYGSPVQLYSTNGYVSTQDGSPYGGPLLIPLIGGSGGGGYSESSGNGQSGGGGGGGAILLASNVSISVTGSVSATGGGDLVSFGYCTGRYGGGSGGGIRLVAPMVTGAGTLDVRGSVLCNRGGFGRIRIDATTRAFTFNSNGANASIGSFLAVAPPTLPSLEVVSVAGNAVAPGQPASIILPFGAPADQLVRIRAAGFGSTPINYTVVLTPDVGGQTKYLVTGVDTSAAPDVRDTTVTIPANNLTRVDVWTTP